MASTFTLSGDAADLGLVDFLVSATGNARKIKGYVRSNLGPADALIDTTTGLTLLGDTPVVFATDGTWSVMLVDTSATDLNIEADTLQYELVVSYTPTGSQEGKRVYRSGWFALIADTEFSALDLDIPSVTPGWRSAFVTEMEAVLAETEAARDGAVAIAGPVDAVVEGLVKNTGGVGPLTSAALSATIAAEGAERFAPLGQSLRPLRAACIGTSIYANGLATANNVVVDVGQAWDYTKMSRYMQGQGHKSWFTWMCLLSGGRILPHYNAAESGSTLTQQLARFSRDVVAQRPDVVFLGDATNDINNAVPDATIRDLIGQMLTLAKAANITPILVGTTRRNDTTAKNQRVREHNEWLRRYAWATGLSFIDPLAALVDPASTTGNVSTTYAPDGLHPNEAGAKLAGQRAVDELDGILAGITNPAKAKFIVQDRAATPNLLTNPLFQDDVNTDGNADSWSIGGTRSLTTDARVLGKLQTMTVTANGQTLNQGKTIDGVTFSVGDRVALSGLIEVDAAAGSLQYNVGLYTLSQVGTWASNAIGYGGSLGGGPVGVDLPLAAFYCELTIPTGATVLRAEAKAFTGTGAIKVAQWRLVNLTTLGLDSIY